MRIHLDTNNGFMLTAWWPLRFSIAKDIVWAFLYTSIAKQLRDELEERFGESAIPLIYQLQ